MCREPFDILVVDDSADDLTLMQLAFEHAGLLDRLHMLGDGQAAMAYLEGAGDYRDRTRHPFPDFVLLDLKMPKMSGFDVLQTVRQSNHLLPLMIHVLSGSALDYDVQRAYSLGANSYLVKPSSLGELVRMVTALHQWHCELWLPRCAPGEVDVPG
jgi:CheY-like chemotaxis protein